MNEILNILTVVLSLAVIVVTAFIVLPKGQKTNYTAHYPTVRKSTLNPPRLDAADYDRYLVEKYILPSKSK